MKFKNYFKLWKALTQKHQHSIWIIQQIPTTIKLNQHIALNANIIVSNLISEFDYPIEKSLNILQLKTFSFSNENFWNFQLFYLIIRWLSKISINHN